MNLNQKNTKAKQIKIALQHQDLMNKALFVEQPKLHWVC